MTRDASRYSCCWSVPTGISNTKNARCLAMHVLLGHGVFKYEELRFLMIDHTVVLKNTFPHERCPKHQ